MSAQSTPRPQQVGFFAHMLRHKDSVMAIPSASSLTPSLTTLMQGNDELARENYRLQKRNEELVQQSELNQELFQETSEALMAKQSEIADLEGIQRELRECIRRNDDASNETIHTLGLQLEDLASQLEEAQEMAAKREAPFTKYTDEQQQCQQELGDSVVVSWTELYEKDKTIHFLRCRQAKSDRRIDKLKENLAAAEKLSRDWFETIKLANSKVNGIEVKPQAGAGE